MVSALFAATWAPSGLRNLIVFNSFPLFLLFAMGAEVLLDLNLDIGEVAWKHAEMGNFASQNIEQRFKLFTPDVSVELILCQKTS
ncbi:hypothetical protein BDN71DRAFT_142833 [Pleurotus eryngii]|uniref:Uncharacterized protein n=1 Tax=Pleurotus eryngii TaxID=5323 RepID=A0A9P5ZR66_PLEER|nr:hypothetical protein BDN71DRAFT_142833 [Pleurotus eryngii]